MSAYHILNSYNRHDTIYSLQMKKHFVHLIADYGVGDPAFGEVIQKLKMLAPDLDVYPTSVPPFSTLNTGFWIAQYALHNTFDGLAIYSNTAPRKDKKEAREKNEGEGLVYAKLKNGIVVVAVNAGYCMSFIKKDIVDFRKVNVANKGSQFRSRDFYPDAVVKILNNDPKILGEKLDVKSIPSVPAYLIASIDGYGNMKTSTRRSQVKFKEGERLKVRIDNETHVAYFADGNFSVTEGELAFAAGSSGGDSDPFIELFLRGGSAWELFNKPKIESEISFDETPEH